MDGEATGSSRDAQDPTQHPVDGAHPRASVLLAESDPVLARAIRRSLADAGVRVVAIVRATAEALAVCEKLKPDAAIVDLEMAGVADAEFLTALRAARPDLVVIAFSGPHWREAAWELPIDDYITKPADLDKVDEDQALALVRGRLRRVAQLVG
jgi:DNA-binding NarL/FixJ family response regulator